MSVVLATAGFDHMIRFWEAPSGICSRLIKFPDSQVNRLEITPDKQFIAAAGNPTIRLYEIQVGDETKASQPVLTLEGHTSSVTSIGFQKEGRYLYSGSEDGTIKIWDLRDPNYSRSFNAGSGVNSVTLRTDRDEFVSGDQNGNIKVWDFGGNGCINSLQPSMVSGSTGEANGNGRKSSQGVVPIQAVDISEDSRTLVAVSNHGTVFVWDPQLGGGSDLRPVSRFRAHPSGTYCLHAKIAPDCRHLVTTSSDGTARLWDTTTWENSQTLQNQKWVWDAAFCADSSYLVTSSSDQTARLWNLRTGSVVRQYHGHQSAVTCVALNDSSV